MGAATPRDAAQQDACNLIVAAGQTAAGVLTAINKSSNATC
jgi:hypothetical protein